MNEETNEIRKTLSKAYEESKNSNPDLDKILYYCEECEEGIAQLNSMERAELERLDQSTNILLAKVYWEMANDENDKPESRDSAFDLYEIHLGLAKVSPAEANKLVREWPAERE